MATDTNSRLGRPEIESRLMLNPFEPTKTCLKKLKSLLKFFESVYPDQNSTDIEKIKDNKTVENGKLSFYMDCFTGVQHFCIPSNVATEVIAVAHEDKHLGFIKYYKIVAKL